MNIHLGIRNRDTCFIQSILHIFRQTPFPLPKIIRREPAADSKIHCALRQFIHIYKMIHFLYHGFILFQNLLQDFLRLPDICVIGYPDFDIQPSAFAGGYIGQTGIGKRTVWQYNYPVIRRCQLCVKQFDRNDSSLVPVGIFLNIIP